MRHLICVYVLCVGLLPAAPVSAQSTADSEGATAAETEDIVRARSIAARGQRAYASGQFDVAQRQFEEAWQLDPHPVLRFNHARSTEAINDLPAARNLYRLVIEESVYDDVSAAAERRLTGVLESLTRAGFDAETVTSAQYLFTYPATIEASHDGAEVYVDGFRIGTTPLIDAPLLPGTHQVYVVHPETRSVTQEIIVTPSGANRFYVELPQRMNTGEYIEPPPGRLTVLGPVTGMHIFLDGRPADETTPARAIVLPAGPFTIRVVHPLYDDFSRTVRIEPGVETIVDASNEMDQTASRYDLRSHQRIGRALIPVGAAITAAGAVTGVLALRNERAYDDNPGASDRRDHFNAANNYATATDVLLSVGATTLLTGVIMRAVRGREERTPDYIYREDLFRFGDFVGSVQAPSYVR